MGGSSGWDVSVIECFSLKQSTSAQLVHALICELLGGLDRLEFVFRPIASESLIRKGLSGLGGHRLSDVAGVASALRKLDALMWEVFQGGLKCLMGLSLWGFDDDPFWRCGISTLAFKKNINETHLFSRSVVRFCLRGMFEGTHAGVILSIYEEWMRAISKGFWCWYRCIAVLVTSPTLLLVGKAKLSLEVFTWCILRGFYIFLFSHPSNISYTCTQWKSRAVSHSLEKSRKLVPSVISESYSPKVLVL